MRVIWNFDKWVILKSFINFFKVEASKFICLWILYTHNISYLNRKHGMHVCGTSLQVIFFEWQKYYKGPFVFMVKWASSNDYQRGVDKEYMVEMTSSSLQGGWATWNYLHRQESDPPGIELWVEKWAKYATAGQSLFLRWIILPVYFGVYLKMLQSSKGRDHLII